MSEKWSQRVSTQQDLLALTVTIETIAKPSTIAVTVTVALACKTDLAGDEVRILMRFQQILPMC